MGLGQQQHWTIEYANAYSPRTVGLSVLSVRRYYSKYPDIKLRRLYLYCNLDRRHHQRSRQGRRHPAAAESIITIAININANIISGDANR